MFWDQNRDTLYHRPSSQILADLYCLIDVPVIYGEPTATQTSTSTTLTSIPYRKIHWRLMHASKGIVEEAC